MCRVYNFTPMLTFCKCDSKDNCNLEFREFFYYYFLLPNYLKIINILNLFCSKNFYDSLDSNFYNTYLLFLVEQPFPKRGLDEVEEPAVSEEPTMPSEKATSTPMEPIEATSEVLAPEATTEHHEAPTEPSVAPTDPPVGPTDPSVLPTEQPVDPTSKPTNQDSTDPPVTPEDQTEPPSNSSHAHTSAHIRPGRYTTAGSDDTSSSARRPEAFCLLVMALILFEFI